MQNRCVIVGGADINNYEYIRSVLRDDDFVIFCDSGLRHQSHLGVEPSLIVGDFDSHENPNTDIETIVLPCEKDDTDTVFAVKEGIKRGYTDFLLIGVVGARLDHTLGNVYILEMLHNKGLTGKISDDYSEMEIVADKPISVDHSYAYFSLLNITGTANGVTVTNAKYPLSDAEIPSDYQYGISNEVLKGKRSEISVAQGKLLLIKVK